jgi:hypothetical protein
MTRYFTSLVVSSRCIDRDYPTSEVQLLSARISTNRQSEANRYVLLSHCDGSLSRSKVSIWIDWLTAIFAISQKGLRERTRSRDPVRARQ